MKKHDFKIWHKYFNTFSGSALGFWIITSFFKNPLHQKGRKLLWGGGVGILLSFKGHGQLLQAFNNLLSHGFV
jgi:hypothetical protein